MAEEHPPERRRSMRRRSETTSASASPVTGLLPVILAVDDDEPVLAAIVRDLRAEYGERFSIFGATSGDEVLEMLRTFRLRGRRVALIVADQRMPGLTGLDVLRGAIDLYPDAKRVLLTAYSDNEVAIKAINEIRLDHYLMKPWDPPDEELYPVLSDLLDDWQATVPLEAAGIRIIGHAWSAEGHQLRDFLARNLVPFQWLDIEADADAARLLSVTGAGVHELPLVLFPDGTHLVRPSRLQVGRKIGLNTRARARVYELVIVGAGPAGLAAAVYAATEGLKTLIVEREAPGGQAGRSKRIENYLGFPVGLSGGDLARRAVAQVLRFGAEILSPVGAVGLTSQDGYHTLQLADGSEVSGRAVLLAAGVSYRLLEVPGAARLTGCGIFYGSASSEALAVRGQPVYILGGGNSAGQAAVYLARFAQSVTLIVRRPTLSGTMSQYLAEQIERTSNIAVRYETDLAGVIGEEQLERISLENLASGDVDSLRTPALFVFIGAKPQTDWLQGIVVRDPEGHIVTGAHLLREGLRPAAWKPRREPLWLESSLSGVFAAGDVRYRSIKGIGAAVGEGSMALQLIRQYLGGTALIPPLRIHVPAVAPAENSALPSAAAAPES